MNGARVRARMGWRVNRFRWRCVTLFSSLYVVGWQTPWFAACRHRCQRVEGEREELVSPRYSHRTHPRAEVPGARPTLQPMGMRSECNGGRSAVFTKHAPIATQSSHTSYIAKISSGDYYDYSLERETRARTLRLRLRVSRLRVSPSRLRIVGKRHSDFPFEITDPFPSSFISADLPPSPPRGKRYQNHGDYVECSLHFRIHPLHSGYISVSEQDDPAIPRQGIRR